MTKTTTNLINLEGEIWRDVVGYENKYLVSNKGRVWSFRSKKFLKLWPQHGYLRVSLSDNYIQKNFYVHRLVAEAFVVNDRPDIATQVNHIDWNKHNNCAENLEWVTAQENVNWLSKPKGKRVAAFDAKTGEPIKV